ncbi:hypothetical protein J2S43_001928 [Catenuloplanes nepalensis]|uniref:Uncharacterized protein n=1 Tax=Catenuloplanes nepalensis TaxID=587533 RepID=A0ABT9MQT3_9ACTN|nr:hypothetical protein [Catenuloplanes nepalensis]MDP9793416.1 hypothetical protein [Catenuloplanes nepalensis]
MASQTYLLSDPDRTVVSARPVSVPGGRRVRRGWLTEVRLPAGARLGRHGDALAGRMISVLGLGLLCALLAILDLPVAARVTCVALLAAFGWLGVAYRRTNRLARLVRGTDVHVLTSDEDRDDLHTAVRLAQRVWAHRVALPSGDSARALGRSIEELAALLVQRQRLREIWTGLDRHSDADLPADSPAVRAARQQGERADALWSDLDGQVKRHLTALRNAAETGAGLIREIEFGDAARHTRAALDDLGAPAVPSPVSDLDSGFVSAYRDLAARYGRDLYS